MAYIPKNQYSVKYTNGGEFILVSNSRDYKGYYIETIKGTYYAGNDPQLTRGQLAKKTLKISNNILVNKINNRVYNILNPNTYKKQSRNQPIPASTPFPTPEDYQLGFFKRYLSYKRNTKTFKEITKDTHDKLLKGQGYDNNLYQAIEIKWVITEDPSSTNLDNLRYYETKFPGIIDFFVDPSQYAIQAGVIRLSEGVRIYPDGNSIPKALPAAYQKGNTAVNTVENPKVPKYQHCKNCSFFKQNYCNKWEAQIEQAYWCAAYKGVAGEGKSGDLDTPSTPQTPTPRPQRQTPTTINTNPVTSRTSYSPGY
jgi:hypothetical protein